MEAVAAARAGAAKHLPPPPAAAPGEHPVVKPPEPKRPSRRIKLPENVERHVGDLFSAQGRFLRGENLVRKGKFKAAAKAFEEAIALAADESTYHAYLGWSRFKSDPKNAHAAKDALASIDKALEIDSDSEKAHFYAGMIQRDTGHKAEAQKSFEKVVQLNPDHKEALRQLRKLGRPG
jgi:tetratricopeptide (TPR) repeat protein